jgi:pimeloyl-ACP methyl ester carboxylesterase
MNPIYFGNGRRRLFGIYESPRVGSANTRAVVLCHPWGSEYVHAHRSMRQLAIKLTVAGFHCLRFDYFGTGDSAGDTTEGELKGWEADIESAIEELQETTGRAEVSLVGLRLGATLAASVAAKQRGAIETLVLWDPVVSGEEYLQGLHVASALMPRRQPAARPAESGGGHEILGFPLPASLAREFQAIDLSALLPLLPARTLILVSHPLPSHDSLRPALAMRSAGSLPIEHVVDMPAWIETWPSTGATPVKVLQRIALWLQQ